MDRRRFPTIEPPPGPGCCICASGFRGYNDPRRERVPLVLNCNHSSCENCILACTRTSKPITCGICQEVSPLPSSFRDADLRSVFPVNMHLLGLWSKRTHDHFEGDSQISFPKKNSKKDMMMPKKNFQSCTECTGPAECFCEACITPYCHLCFKKVHSAARILRDHKSIAMIQEPGVETIKAKDYMCSVHPDKKLELFCNQCYVSICSSCLVSEHNGHNLKSIADKNKEFQDEIISYFARVTDIMNNMLASRKKAKQQLKCSRESTSDSSSKEERIRQHFVRLHAHLEKMENVLLHQLNTSSRVVSLNSAIEKLTNDIDQINATLAKTKSILRSDGFGDFQSLIQELRDLEKKPCILVASSNDTDLNCLQIDHSIFSVLEEHIVLRVEDAVSYQLKTENDAPDSAIAEMPASVSLEEVKAQLLSTHPVRPPSSNAGSLPEYAVEKSGRASPMVSRWSSVSSLSSNSSLALEATQQVAPPDDLVVGITFKAYISYVMSPSDFYVQRHGVRRKLESLQRELRRCGTTCFRSKRDDIVYQLGMYYMTLYSEDGNWSRCQLLDFVGEDEVKVLYIDFGNNQTILKSALRRLPDVLAQIPPFAVRCSIVNCFPRHNNEWDPKAVIVMSKILEGRGSSSITVVRKNQLNGLSIKLYKETETNTIDVGEALIFLELAQCGPAETSMPEHEKIPKPKAYAAQTILKAVDVQNRCIQITHVVSPYEFYVKFTIPDVDFAIMHSNIFKDYASLDKRKSDLLLVYYPATGMAVAVKDDTGFWWRGLVVEMLPHTCTKVFLIDDGRTLIVDWSSLRLLEMKYFRLPPQAYRCSMAEVQPKDGDEWSEEASALLRTYADKELRIVNPEYRDNRTSVLLVHCDTEVDVCINALLVRDGLAKSNGPHGDIVEYPKLPELKAKAAASEGRKKRSGKALRAVNTRPAQKSLPPQLLEKTEIAMKPNDDKIIKDSKGQFKLKVKIIKVVNPGLFFVTLDYLEDSYKEMFSKMNEYYKTNAPDKPIDNLKQDELCVVKTADGCWKRGVVVEEVNSNLLQVTLVDEASVITVSTKTSGILAKIDSEFLSLPDKALECFLGGIVPAGSSSWSLTSVSKMQEFIDNHESNLYITKMKDIPDDKKKMGILLFGRTISKPTATTPACESWTNLNHELRWNGCAKADENTKWDSQGNIIYNVYNVMEDEVQVMNALLKSHFHVTAEGAVDLSRPIGQNPEVYRISWPRAEPLREMNFMAKVTYIGSNCDIWIQDSKNVTVSLNVINEEATKLCEGTVTPYPPIAWEVGDICLGKFHIDGKWYRSEILKPDALPSGHLVRFVDYGNEEYLTDDELRRADGITLRPIQSHICYFDNLAPVGETWKDTYIEEIHKMLVDKLVVVSLRVLGNGLLGIKSMVLPDGQDALTEIVSRRLGVYRMTVADTRNPSAPKTSATSPDVVAMSKSIDSTSGASDTNSAAYFSSEEGAVAANLDSPQDGACSYASPVVNWLSIYETEHNYEIPKCGFHLIDIPAEVNEFLVDITSILSPGLYMMQISSTDNEDLKKVMNSYNELVKKMQEEAQSLSSLKPPFLFKDCCCKFEGDDMWYRAVVVHDTSEEDGSVVVQFVDYGNVQATMAHELRELREEWFSVPVQAMPCYLYGYEFCPDVSQEEAMEFLRQVLLEKPFNKAVIKARQKNLGVELYDESGVLLYQPLIEMEHLLPSSSD